jgi:hypothetical protein
MSHLGSATPYKCQAPVLFSTCWPQSTEYIREPVEFWQLLISHTPYPRYPRDLDLEIEPK